MPVELEHKAMRALKLLSLYWSKTLKGRVGQLNKLEKFSLISYQISVIYKEIMKKLHNTQILEQDFKVGDWGVVI